MNRQMPSGAPWPRHKVKARRQRRRRESHGRTAYKGLVPPGLSVAALHCRQQLDAKDYLQ